MTTLRYIEFLIHAFKGDHFEFGFSLLQPFLACRRTFVGCKLATQQISFDVAIQTETGQALVLMLLSRSVCSLAVRKCTATIDRTTPL